LALVGEATLLSLKVLVSGTLVLRIVVNLPIFTTVKIIIFTTVHVEIYNIIKWVQILPHILFQSRNVVEYFALPTDNRMEQTPLKL
jgi:hypothetical protein